MSDTKYFIVDKFLGCWSIYIAEDSQEVIEGFKELAMADFAISLGDKSTNKRKLAFLDGTLIKETRTSPLDYWLERRGLLSDEHRFLIGYSGDEANSTSRCVRWYVKSANVRADVEELLRLCQETARDHIGVSAWPQRLAQPNIELSRTIHALQNLFLPVALDAQTLNEAVGSKEAMISDILRDHFGLEPCGYLREQSRQHRGGDILWCVAALCDSLSPDVGASVKDERSAIIATVTSARSVLQTRADGSSRSVAFPSVGEIHAHLQAITDASDKLIKALREVHSRMEKGTK